MVRSKIIATGAYMPTERIPNDYFLNTIFFDRDQSIIRQPTETVIQKFKAITGIAERRYAPPGITASDMASIAAQTAMAHSRIDPESIDQIIVAHNYGDMHHPEDRKCTRLNSSH